MYVAAACACVQIWLINTDQKNKLVPVIESLRIISCIYWLSKLLHQHHRHHSKLGKTPLTDIKPQTLQCGYFRLTARPNVDKLRTQQPGPLTRRDYDINNIVVVDGDDDDDDDCYYYYYYARRS